MEPLDRADLIYHETQEGALCGARLSLICHTLLIIYSFANVYSVQATASPPAGVHALNTLLQAPHFK